jgi:hypothetical protein
MRRIALLVLPLLTLFPLRADALSVRDIVELTRAGMGEDILLALIVVDPSVFPIDASTLKMRKGAGDSERVLIAMIRSGRSQPPDQIEPMAPVAVQESQTTPEPQVIVIDHHDAPQVREVPVAVPVYIPVPTRRVHVDNRADADDVRTEDRRRDDQHADHGKRAEPVYWGFGGQLRPDAWQPTSTTVKPVKKDR